MTQVQLSTSMVIYEKKDRIAYITMNRPEALNALNTELRRGLQDAFRDFRDDPEMLVAILTGNGRAFSSGADLKEVNERQAQGLPGFAGENEERILGITELNIWKPIIAAIDGFCVAGGLELALECDIRVASEASSFGLPEPRWSILASYGLHHLSRMVPLGEALYIQLTGSRISAAEAYRIGLIHSYHPDRAATLAAAEKIAEEIKLCAPLAVQAIKKIVKIGRNLPVEYSYKLAEDIGKAIQNTEDAKEGPRAFAEKRAPQWKMR